MSFVELDDIISREKSSILPIFLWYEEWWWVRIVERLWSMTMSNIQCTSRPIIIMMSLILCSGRTTATHSTLGDQFIFCSSINRRNGNSGRGAENIISIGTCTCRHTWPLLGEVCEVRMSKCRGAHLRLSILRGKLAIYGFDEKISMSTKWWMEWGVNWYFYIISCCDNSMYILIELYVAPTTKGLIRSNDGQGLYLSYYCLYMPKVGIRL